MSTGVASTSSPPVDNRRVTEIESEYYRTYTDNQPADNKHDWSEFTCVDSLIQSLERLNTKDSTYPKEELFPDTHELFDELFSRIIANAQAFHIRHDGVAPPMLKDPKLVFPEEDPATGELPLSAIVNLISNLESLTPIQQAARRSVFLESISERIATLDEIDQRQSEVTTLCALAIQLIDERKRRLHEEALARAQQRQKEQLLRVMEMLASISAYSDTRASQSSSSSSKVKVPEIPKLQEENRENQMNLYVVREQLQTLSEMLPPTQPTSSSVIDHATRNLTGAD